jgi:hypothetical protein
MDGYHTGAAIGRIVGIWMEEKPIVRDTELQQQTSLRLAFPKPFEKLNPH